MHVPTITAVILTLLSSTLAQVANTTREYHLRTQLKRNQPNKARFDNLWLVASHTGAGLNDAVLYSNKSYAIKGFLNQTANATQANGSP